MKVLTLAERLAVRVTDLETRIDALNEAILKLEEVSHPPIDMDLVQRIERLESKARGPSRFGGPG